MTPSLTNLDSAGLNVYANKERDEAEWLEQRRGRYTATQVTAIVGSNPYTKLIDVWNGFTDPDFDPDAERNRWLEERAAFGQSREPEIIKWASEDERTGGPKNPFTPTGALVGLPQFEAKRYAASPDGFKFARDGVLVLIECKASQQNWEVDGIPQHIYDQIQWQIYTTGAVTVWLAQELVKWVGRGANKQAEVVGRYLVPIQRDDNRLAWILSRVEWFEGLLAEGIAPESDLDLREIVESEPNPFDATPEDLAEWEEAVRANDLLNELAALREGMTASIKRDAEIVDLLKPIVKQYEGRRIHLIGERFIAKLVRGTRQSQNLKALSDSEVRRITTWTESETVKFEPNPEYVAPAATDNESE